MTALKGRAIKSFLARPDKDVAAILVYGPDAGLARQRVEKLALGVVSDLKDPFNALELSDADLKDDPGRLADEISALSFAGGARAIRLRTQGDGAAKAAEILLKGLDDGYVKPNGLVIIEAGDLTPRSALRKMFEKSKRGAALPCYADTPGDVRELAQDMARTEDLTFDREALDFLVSMLGADHGVSHSEIEKLILYKGTKSTRGSDATITLSDVRACLVDGQSGALDAAANAAADGDAKALSAALFRAQAAGASPIGLLRALQRQMVRLKTAQAFIGAGESPDAAMKKLRPPVFFAEKPAFGRRLGAWSGARLELAGRMLVEAELDAKSTGAPQREIVERAALRLAMMAGAGSRR